MSLLSPLGLVWLAGIPVLLWLWRLASTRRLIQIPSLIPFEQLHRKAALRRSHLVVNLLFWLQLSALALLAIALANPFVLRRPAKTMLVIVDTSASMGAVSSGQTRLARAQRLLKDRLAKMASGDRAFLIGSAPIAVLTPEPTGDLTTLARVVDDVTISDVSGNLATAAHIGRALLDRPADEVWIATDEPAPESPSPDVRWLGVGEPRANVALVALDPQGGLCGERSATLLATVQNFSDRHAQVQVTAEQSGRELARAETSLSARERGSLSLAVPESAVGWVTLTVRAVDGAEHDALDVDNRADVMLRRGADVPVAVVSNNAALRQLVTQWLGACGSLTWTTEVPEAPRPYLLVTDREDPLPSHAIGVLHLVASSTAGEPTLAHWVVTSAHPVGSYLQPVNTVLSSTSSDGAAGLGGEPVIWALRRGQKVPLVLAGELEGRRSVRLLVDPTVTPDATPLLVVFFNSLRWLVGQAETVRTGDPIMVPALERGRVVVQRPDGARDQLTHVGGPFRYDATTRAGLYRIVRGGLEVVRAANFIDPIESNLLEPVSTWRLPAHAPPADAALPQPVRQSLVNLMMCLVLALLIAEWVLYVRKSG